MRPLARALGEAIVPRLDLPFAFFGHSMGASIGFELARHLRRQLGLEPLHFFASARRAPHLAGSTARYRLSDAQLIDALRVMGGTPETVLQDVELMQMLLPIVRADLELIETYVGEPGPPLRCPITAFHGLADDEVSPPAIDAWREHTSGPFALHSFDAGHFFLGSHREQILRRVGDALLAQR